MRGRVHARRTLKGLVADLRTNSFSTIVAKEQEHPDTTFLFVTQYVSNPIQVWINTLSVQEQTDGTSVKVMQQVFFS